MERSAAHRGSGSSRTDGRASGSGVTECREREDERDGRTEDGGLDLLVVPDDGNACEGAHYEGDEEEGDDLEDRIDLEDARSIDLDVEVDETDLLIDRSLSYHHTYV